MDILLIPSILHLLASILEDVFVSIKPVDNVELGKQRHILNKQSKKNNGINILVISTSEIKLSVIINEDDTVKAVKKLHTIFDLD